MNPHLLREVYRRHGIKKKKIKFYKEPKNKNEEANKKDLAKMKRELTKARKDKYRIIYLDETVFTRSTRRHNEWSLPGQNLRID